MFKKNDSINNSVGHQNEKVKKGRDKLINSIALVVVLLLGLSVGTQYFAYVANYDAGLGFSIGKVYMPWNILIWYGKWHMIYPTPLKKAVSISTLVIIVGMFGIFLWQLIRINTNKANKILHGSARWATEKDIKKAGLIEREPNETGGVIVGGWLDDKGVVHYLKHYGTEHVLTVAPTRSGKGLGLVLPTLLTWRSSAVVIDIKRELWNLTAGWRQKYAENKVIRFEPAASNQSACWNPLDEIRIGTQYEIADVQNLASLIVDPDGKGLKSHWDKTAFALLTGVMLFALYKAKENGATATLSSIDRMLSNPEQPVSDLWVEMATHENVVISSSGQDMLDKPEEEAGSVLSTAKAFLSLYRDPIVAKNTSSSDFKIKDLMNYEKPVSLYIVTEATDKVRLRPLTRILISMIFRLSASDLQFENGKPKASYKHRLLFMGDEIASQGKLDVLQESLAFVSGYGILCYLIFQDITQLKSREIGYGHDESISSNCHIQNAYPPNRVETAEYLSKLTGVTTVVKEQITTSGKRVNLLLGGVTRTTQEVQRPLLTSDECMRMPAPEKEGEKIVNPGDMLIYVAGSPAIYGRQVLYFMDPIYLARAQIPPPMHTDYLRKQKQ